MSEVWKDVVGYEGYYKVSDQGRVKSVDREVNHWRGGMRKFTSKMMIVGDRGNGYMRVNLSREHTRKTMSVHSLVLTAFNGDRPYGFQCSHINGDRGNNNAYNLVWESGLDNIRRKEGHGTQQKGEEIGNSKLKEDDIPSIRRLYRTGHFSYNSIARMFGVTKRLIIDIMQEKIWRHI